MDTSVFIDQVRSNKHAQRINDLHYLIRNSSVVLSELSRGATKREEVRFIQQLVKNHPILTPPEGDWLQSGEILSKIYRKRGFNPQKLRDLHFDVLIALTARRWGATLITSNREDFELIRPYVNAALEFW